LVWKFGLAWSWYNGKRIKADLRHESGKEARHNTFVNGARHGLKTA